MSEEFTEDIDLGADITPDMGGFEPPDFEESVDIPENIVEDTGEDFISSEVVDIDDSMLGDFSEIKEDAWDEGDQGYDSFDENLINEIPEDVFENSDMSISDVYDFDGGETFDDIPNEIPEDTIENTDTELPYGYEFSGYETHEFPEVENPKVLKRENNCQEDIIDEIPEDIDTNFESSLSTEDIPNEIQEDIYTEEETVCADDTIDSYEDISSELEPIENYKENEVVQEQKKVEDFIEENSFDNSATETNFENLHNDDVQEETKADVSLEEISVDVDDNHEFLDKEEEILTENEDCVEVSRIEETQIESDEAIFDRIETESEFSEEELQENINRTPISNGEWDGKRGHSTWIPEDAAVRNTIEKYGMHGIEYHNGIPDFDKFSAFDIELNENEFIEKNAHQFMTYNEGLADYFSDLSDQLTGKDCEEPLENSDYRNAIMNIFKCDEAELEDIQSHLNECETPYGFTWHHSQIPGKMQLVPTDIHVSARHRGGQSIWGGGAENR